MGRVRATTASSEVDRQVQAHVAAAERSIREALGVCHRARTARIADLGRVHRVQKDLGAVLGAMSRVQRLTPVWDGGDPDLMPEDERVRRWREEREQERAGQPEPAPEPEALEAEGDS